MFEEDVKFHVAFPVELPRTMRAVVVGGETAAAGLAAAGVARQVLHQLPLAGEVPAAVGADVHLPRVTLLDASQMLCLVIQFM